MPELIFEQRAMLNCSETSAQRRIEKKAARSYDIIAAWSLSAATKSKQQYLHIQDMTTCCLLECMTCGPLVWLDLKCSKLQHTIASNNQPRLVLAEGCRVDDTNSNILSQTSRALRLRDRLGAEVKNTA
jgi:hypothetical protein